MRPGRVLAMMIAMALFAATAVTATTTATAQESNPDIDFVLGPPELWEGPWTGFFFAGGTGVQAADGIQFVWVSDASGSIELEVAGEEISGTFDMSGFNSLLGDGSGTTIAGLYDLAGSGQVQGVPTRPALTGTAGSTGEIAIRAAGFERVVDANSPPMPFDFDVVLSGASCNEVYGSFEVAFEQAAGEAGWRADLFGNVVLVQDSAVVQAAIEQWFQSLERFPIEDPDSARPIPDGAPAIVRAFDEVARRFNAWADRINATDATFDRASDTWATTHATITAAQHLYAELANLSDCEVELLGDLREKFLNFLTQAVLSASRITAERLDDISGIQINQLVQMLVSLGGWGSGSAYPQQAAATEDALRRAAVRVLERWYSPDDPDCAPRGCLAVNDDVLTVLQTAAQLDWELEVGGFPVRTRHLLGKAGSSVPGEGPTQIPIEEAS